MATSSAIRLSSPLQDLHANNSPSLLLTQSPNSSSKAKNKKKRRMSLCHVASPLELPPAITTANSSAKKKKQPTVVLGRIKQSARNLSLGRAQSVRDAIIGYANAQGIPMDPAQFATVGHGISQPNTGICGSDPCAPKNADEWRSNMRVKFRIIQVEAESDVFAPL